MGIAPDFTTSLEALRGVQVPDDMPAGDAVEAMTCVVTLRNVIDHLAAMLTGVLGRCGVAASQGRTPRELLMALGCAPSVAERLVRVGGALPVLPTLAAHAADGAMSGSMSMRSSKGSTTFRPAHPDQSTSRPGSRS